MPQLLAFDPAAVDTAARSPWRYRACLPSPGDGRPISLGEGGTPLVAAPTARGNVGMKLEYVQPSGSYKDRGATVLATALANAGVTSAVEDSSGNAGASLAAYLARAGIGLRLFVPAGTPSAKLRQAEAHGAAIDGDAPTRAAATARAQAALDGGAVYASHIYSPWFVAGVATLAWEIWEDLGRVAPDHVVVPVGHGLLLLGLFEGFRALERAGLIERLPRLHGVQAAACAPVATAFDLGRPDVEPVAADPTSAGGVAVADPPRGGQVLAAVRATGGTLRRVSEAEIGQGCDVAARWGWYIEPTAAVGLCGMMTLLDEIPAGDVVVLPLTGSGLKT